MPTASPNINTFNRGELSPRMQARTDAQLYRHGCSLFENFFPMIQGPATRRPGLRFIAQAMDQDHPCRLIPFEFSTEQAYILELGEGVMRIHMDGGLVQSGGEPLEVSGLPWTWSELAGIKYVQSADVMFLCHPSHAPVQISRTGHDQWSVEEIEWVDGPYLDENATPTTLQPSATSGTVTVTASGDVFAATDVGRHLRILQDSTWGWGRITAFQSATAVTVTTVWDFADTTAVESWRLGAWSGTTGWPRAICFYDGRLWLAGTRSSPQTLWGSRSGDFPVFSPSDEEDNVYDDHGYTHTISADQVNAILWLASGKALVLGTLGGEWKMESSSSDPVSAANPIAPRRETTFGSRDIQSIQVGHSSLFVQRQGRKLRSLHYAFETDSWNAGDLTIMSEHITRSGIQSMAWVGEPEPVLFLIRGDGQLLALSYENSENVVGWCRYVTDGFFESLAAIPGDDGDELWVLVRRRRAMKGFDIALHDAGGDPAAGEAGDGFVVMEGAVFAGGWLVRAEAQGERRWFRYLGTGSIDAGSGEVAVTLADSPGAGQLEPVLDSNGDVQTQYWEELESPWEDIRCVERMEQPFDGTDINSAFYLDSGLPYEGAATRFLSGLDHLRGREAHVLGDGAVLPPVTVDSLGHVELEQEASHVLAGLPYTSSLSTMPLDYGGRDGTALGKRKRVHRVRLELLDTMAVNGMSIGPDPDSMDQVDFRNETDGVDEVPRLFSGILDTGKFPGGLVRKGGISIRHGDPMPCTILAIYPQMLTETS